MTCSHVVDAVGGEDNVKVNGRNAVLVVSGENRGIDLAVLRFTDPNDKLMPLSLTGVGKEGQQVRIEGVQPFNEKYKRVTYFEGKLRKSLSLFHGESSRVIPSWEFEGSQESGTEVIKPGCSGSPVIDAKTG
ncbi:MAG: serine protease, partial [Bacteroidota bacterium]